MKRIFLTVLCSALAACVPWSTVHRPDKGTRAEQNQFMLAQITDRGQNGDWLAVRGYKPTDDLVATVTNAPISHAAILDRDNQAVIEADSTGVHRTPLGEFVDKCHRIILIRPIWASADHGERALQKARALVGKPYDFLGTVGMDQKDRFYCSELVLHVYKPFFQKNQKMPPVVEPSHLYLWGTLLYDSRPRDWWGEGGGPSASP